MADLFKLLGTIAIDCGDSKTKIDEVTDSAKDLSEKIGGVGKQADETSEKLKDGSKFHAASEWLGNVLSKLSEKAINLVGNLGKTGFGFNTNMESYQYQFEALIGDADKAAQLIADLQELAKISPLGMEGLANNAVMLLQSGQELTEIVPTLEMLGNLSLGNTDRMNSVVRAYTQILGKGGLMAQEMYQLGDAMVPIVEIMTKYGGERYADGSWYEAKMTDPTYKIPAEDMVAAFNAATAEGGKWYDYMLTIMDSFAGQSDRFGEEGKETLGAFFEPFFDVAKSEVLPGLIDSLAAFRTWVDENKEAITAVAETVGTLVAGGFDAMLGAFQWCIDHGNAVAVAIGGISTALLIGAIAAHPYAAAITAVVAGLAALTSAYEAHQDAIADEFMSPYADQKSPLYGLAGKYAGWADELKEAAGYYIEAAHLGYNTDWEEEDLFAAARKTGVSDDEVNAFMNDAKNAINSADFTIGSEYLWFDENAKETLQKQLGDIELNAETSVSAPNAQAELQTELDGMNLTATVDVEANYRMLQLATSLLETGTDGSHANGLDYVPRNGYRALLHEGEAVLTKTEANAWRGGGGGESAESIAAAVREAVAGLKLQVVLDTGVVVGQLAHGMDKELGSIAGRKGRRN